MCSSMRGRAPPSSRRTARKLWVSSEVGGTVSVIDPASHKRDAEDHASRFPGLAKEAIQPVGIAIHADGKRAFVALARPIASR